VQALDQSPVRQRARGEESISITHGVGWEPGPIDLDSTPTNSTPTTGPYCSPRAPFSYRGAVIPPPSVFEAPRRAPWRIVMWMCRCIGWSESPAAEENTLPAGNSTGYPRENLCCGDKGSARE